MSFNLKSNADSIVKKFKDFPLVIKREIPAVMERRNKLFIGMITRNQMSGRKGSTGLNVVTGTLRRSWKSMTQSIAKNINIKIWTDVRYARYHEEGIKGKRRLFVKDAFFKSENIKRYEVDIMNSLKTGG